MARQREIETEISEGVTIRSTAGFAGSFDVQTVWLWDAGPERPVQPKRPQAPSGKEGDPQYELAALEFRQELETYSDDLRRYQAQRKEFQDFETRYGGAYEIRFWSVDAQDALTNDGAEVKQGRQNRRRYFISARTRGYENLPNGGLPPSLKPGHGHEENLRREAAGESEMVVLRKQDPVFGSEVRS